MPDLVLGLPWERADQMTCRASGQVMEHGIICRTDAAPDVRVPRAARSVVGKLLDMFRAHWMRAI